MLTKLLFNKILKKTETLKVIFDGKRCLRARWSKSECQVCLQECKAGALKLNARGISYSPEKCSGCMGCVSVCPNDAFDGGVDLATLLDIAHSSSKVALTCKNNDYSRGNLIIPCIGCLSEVVLAAMNTLARDTIYVDLSH